MAEKDNQTRKSLANNSFRRPNYNNKKGFEL